MTGMFLTSCTTKTSFGVAEVGEYVKTDWHQPGRAAVAAVLGRGPDLAVRQSAEATSKLTRLKDLGNC